MRTPSEHATSAAGKIKKANHGHHERRRRRYRTTTAPQKAGLPPGSLVYVGVPKTDRPKVTLMAYSGESFREEVIADIAGYQRPTEPETVTWINVDGVYDVPLLEQLGQTFGIHALVLEDILNTNQRPKIEDFGDYVFIVFKMIYYGNAEKKEIVTEQVSLVLGPDYVLSFQDAGGDVFDLIRNRLRSDKGRMRKLKADYLAYALMDAVVDFYFVLLENLGEMVENYEEAIIADPTMEILEKIHDLRSQMLLLRRSVWPLREVVNAMQRGETSLVHRSTIIYLRDLYDHTVQVIDTIETYRDILSGMMDIYLSSTSNRLNEVMKVLTMISTIFIPLSFIVGLYGMNFKYMPELDKAWGYPMVWGIILVVAFGMLVYFRKKKWL